MDKLIYCTSSGGRGTAVRKALYNSRQGQFANRKDLVHSESTNLPEWTGGDPIRLFRASDKHERKNGTAYCEVMVALPNELGTGQRQIDLARDLAKIIAGGRPCFLNIHSSQSSLEDMPNIHMHAMYSNRVPDGIARSEEGTFLRFNPDEPAKGGCRKLDCGRHPAEVKRGLLQKREEVAQEINQHLDQAGLPGSIRHVASKRPGDGGGAERHLGQARVRRMSVQEKADFVSRRRGRRQPGDSPEGVDS